MGMKGCRMRDGSKGGSSDNMIVILSFFPTFLCLLHVSRSLSASLLSSSKSGLQSTNKFLVPRSEGSFGTDMDHQ